MERTDVRLNKADTILEELDALHQAISRRAYELFGGQANGSALIDWLTAEREVVWKPAVEVRQKDNELELLAAVPGVEAKDLDVQVTPEDVLIKADIHHLHKPEKGTVRLCEFQPGNLFRSVHLPDTIDPYTAQAVYRDGMLHVTAALAKTAQARQVDVKAA